MVALICAGLLAAAVWVALVPAANLIPTSPARRFSAASALDSLIARATTRRREVPVAELLNALAAELTAGRPIGEALSSAAADLPICPCPTAVRAVANSGDVASALRHDARSAGAGELRSLAACWEVASGSGVGLALAVGRLAESVRSTSAARAELRSELAATRATGRLLAGLPAFGIALGAWIGSDPIGWLLGSWVGRGVLLVGLLLQLVAVLWLRVIVRRVEVAL